MDVLRLLSYFLLLIIYTDTARPLYNLSDAFWLFRQYREKFKKLYNTTEELVFRYGLFYGNLRQLNIINWKPGSEWYAVVDWYSDMTDAEAYSRMGVKSTHPWRQPKSNFPTSTSTQKNIVIYNRSLNNDIGHNAARSLQLNDTSEASKKIEYIFRNSPPFIPGKEFLTWQKDDFKKYNSQRKDVDADNK